jgi:hypothetical protein
LQTGRIKKHGSLFSTNYVDDARRRKAEGNISVERGNPGSRE